MRRWHGRRFRAVRITYPRGRTVTVPRGFSILEASRWADIPHRSVCGGRGRCSTCRVRVIEGAEALGRPGPVEQATLARIAAPSDVRLACQVRPTGDIEIVPLVGAAAGPAVPGARFGAAVEGGQELTIAAMFVDLRDSTRLAAGRLPFDALFLVDHYIQAVTGPIRANGGRVTSIAGDGVMSIFGLEGDAAAGAHNALRAALQLWRGIEAMNEELAEDLGAPLRFGVGVHVGPAVVGLLGGEDDRSLQFLGDTGNVAAKLEAQTKQLGCTLIASTAATDLVNFPRSGMEVRTVEAQGRTEPVEVAVFRQAAELERVLNAVLPL
jgi:adenylate cyclase